MGIPATIQRLRPRRSRSGRRDLSRAWVITTVIGVALLLVSALVFAVSAGTRNITQHAEALHIADETLRAATVARAQIAMVNHLGNLDNYDEAFEVADALVSSDKQAREALSSTSVGVDELARAGGRISPLLASSHQRFQLVGQQVLAAVAAKDYESAGALVREGLDDSYTDMFEELLIERDRQLGEVTSSDRLMARLGDIARFLVALLIPLAVIVIYREIVRRQQRQAELEVRLKAEKEVGRARDDFVANASHEFRTPLTSIYGLSQLIEEDEAVPEATREMAAMISSEAGDLSRMVEDLLTTARLEAGALTFYSEQVMTHEDIDDIVRPFLKAGTEIEMRVKPAVVRVDRLRQRQVLRNLLSNARKYGGPNLRLTGERDGQWFKWTVADDGEGVPEELQAKLFERFMHQGTTVVSPGGVGLGLSIVKALAEGMGGTVDYHRRDGWSEFEIRVPLATAASAGATSVVTGSGTPRGGGFEIAASSPYDGGG